MAPAVVEAVTSPKYIEIFVESIATIISITKGMAALTGRVVALKVETDGDLHIALQDATGDKPGTVVIEVPAKPQWCELRKMVFEWTQAKFPFHTSSAKKLNIDDPPTITVVGKVFFDIGHAPKDQSNRRKRLPDYAAWEVHPVMKIEVQ